MAYGKPVTDRARLAWSLLMITSLLALALISAPDAFGDCRVEVDCDPVEPPEPPPPVTDPVARFDWSMPARSRDDDLDGLLDMESHWDEGLGHGLASGSSGVDWRQNSWQVRFNACASEAPGAITSFRWEVAGRPAETRTTCAANDLPSFPQEGEFEVKLTITAADGRTDSVSHQVHVQDRLIVTMGDSYASGEGNPDKPQKLGLFNVALKGPEWVEKRCHRSAHAASARAALRLERADPHTSVTYIAVTCSGATTAALRSSYNGADPAFFSRPLLPPQVDQVAQAVGNRRVDDLMMSIGGNDIGFATVIADCFVAPRCDQKPEAVSRYNAAREDLPNLLGTIKDRVAQKLNVASTYLTEYPDSTRDGNGTVCENILAGFGTTATWGIDKHELGWASNHLLATLNATLGDFAGRTPGWRLIGGIAEDSRAHGYCASGAQRWTRTFEESCDMQGPKLAVPVGSCWIPDVKGTLHPNEKAHAAIADRIVESLSANPPVPVPGGEQSPDTDNDGLRDPVDPDDDNDGRPDAADAFPRDAAEQDDNDGDGIGDRADADDDNDGVPDAQDAFPKDPSRSSPPDTTAPDTTIGSGPSGTIRSTSASFGFGASERGSRFECRLDGATWSDCTSPQAYTNLSPGPHSFEVRAVDAAGNADSTPAQRRWSIDRTAPTVKTVSPPSGGNGIASRANVLVTFSEPMLGSSLSVKTVKLVRKGTTIPVAATVRYDATRRRATLDPKAALRSRSTYTATVTTQAKDLVGNPLARGKTWSFTVR